MNIFARELVDLLAAHGKELGNLYTVHSKTHQILPHKVTRLKRSLRQNMTATLNADDLALLAGWLGLPPNGSEILRLRAALVGEAIRHLLGGRMNVLIANQLGQLTFQLLVDQNPALFFQHRANLLNAMRGGPDDEDDGSPWLLEQRAPDDTLRDGGDDAWDRGLALRGSEGAEQDPDELLSEDLEPALEGAVESYEQGSLWLEVARDTADPAARQGYLALAHALLKSALDRISQVRSDRGASSQRQGWLGQIDRALREEAALRQKLATQS